MQYFSPWTLQMWARFTSFFVPRPVSEPATGEAQPLPKIDMTPAVFSGVTASSAATATAAANESSLARPSWRSRAREGAANLLRSAASVFEGQPAAATVMATAMQATGQQPKADLVRSEFSDVWQQRLQERTLETPPGAYWDGFRSTSWTQRDLSPLSHDLQISGVQWLFGCSPIARRALEIHRDFVCSDGIKASATSKNDLLRADCQEVIDDFWADDIMDWGDNIGQYVMELAMSGEWTLHARVNPISGRTRMGLISPESIDRIEINPLNAMDLQYVVLKQQVQVGWLQDGTPRMQQRFRTIHRDNDQFSPSFGQLIGDTQYEGVFHMRVNGLLNATRGTSDLLPVIDWLDLLHQLLHSETDRAMLTRAVVADVSVDTGGNAKAIEECRKRNIDPPRPGAVNIHDTNEKWQFIAPSLGTADFLPLIEWIMGMVLGSLGVPEVFFFEAKGTNKAAADQTTTTAYTRTRERQNRIKAFLEKIFRFVLEKADGKYTLKDGRVFFCPEEDRTVEVTTIDPDRKQYDAVARALDMLCDVLSKGTLGHWISDEEAANAYRNLLKLIGIELEPLAEAQEDAEMLGDEEPAPTPLEIAHSAAQKYLDQRKAALDSKVPEPSTGGGGFGSHDGGSGSQA